MNVHTNPPSVPTSLLQSLFDIIVEKLFMGNIRIGNYVKEQASVIKHLGGLCQGCFLCVLLEQI